MDDISDSEGDNTRDTDYLTDAEILVLLCDEEPKTISSPILTVAQQDTKTPGAASAAKSAAPNSSSEEDTPVAPEMQSIQLEPVTEIPQPEGSVDASRTTPESGKGGSGDEKDPSAWKTQIDLSHIRPASVQRRVILLLEKHKSITAWKIHEILLIFHASSPRTVPVSYTHLTLPTKRIV